MRIVFGYNNFLIKSYSAEELGINNEQGASQIKFEVRQRYAHFFWIPFFPIGKMWVLKKPGNDDLYKMPEELQAAIISQHGKPRTPWYSFALILLGMAIGLFVLMGDAIDSHNYKTSFYNKVGENKMLIKYPTTGDCYVLLKYEEPNRFSHSDNIILKVKGYDENKTRFISLYPELYKDAESKDLYEYHKSFDLAEAYNYNPIYIDKSQLVNALNDEYTAWKTPVKIEPLEGYYSLEKIDRRELDN